ncbi:MAG: hypothetical protein ACFB10_04590 [Salibacteraceae bacterium]
MRFLLAMLCLVALWGSPAAQELSLPEVRNQFVAAATSESAATELYKRLEKSKSELSIILMGYYGVMEARMAEYSSNPWKRYSYFSDGKERLENSILQQPNNTELRFLRFVLQTQVPEFLGYNENINEDKKIMLGALGKSTLSSDLEATIVSYLLSSTHCTEADKAVIKRWKRQS